MIIKIILKCCKGYESLVVVIYYVNVVFAQKPFQPFNLISDKIKG